MERLIFRGRDLPNHGGISKWTRPVTVGIDWPRFEPTPQGKFTKEQSYFSENLTQHYPVIRRAIESAIPHVERLTGLAVRFVPPSDAEDRTENFARIRIIPTVRGVTASFPAERFFRTAVQPHSPYRIEEFEWLALGRVPFAPEAGKHGAGYFLPSRRNEIDMAVCRVSLSDDANAVTLQVWECILRSLGLPDLSATAQPSLLGRNKPASLEKGFPRHDERLLRALYCDGVAPGITKWEVVGVLAENEKCLAE